MRVLYVSLSLVKKITSLTQYTILLYFFFARAKQGFCLFLIASALLHAPSAIETHARLGNIKVILCTVLLSSSCFSTALLLQSIIS